MNALEKLKLTQELKKAIDERNAQTNPLNKLVWVKKVQKLRQELGFIGSVPVQKQADDERNYVDSLVFNQDGKLLLVQRSGIVPHQQQTNQKQIYGDDVGVLSDDEIEQLNQAKVDDVQNMGESERQSTTSDNPIGVPITNRPNLPTTKNARQKANDLAIELVERINQNNLSRDDLTNDELTVILNHQHPTRHACRVFGFLQ